MHNIIHSNSIDYLNNLGHKLDFDICVTSPPYKCEDGYTSELIYCIVASLYKHAKDDALLFVNFGHLAGHKSRPFEVCSLFEELFTLQETFIWVKNHYRPIQGKRRVNNLFEYVFMFSKHKMPELDRLSVGIPYADVRNVGRFSDINLKCAGNVLHIPYETINKKANKLHNDRFPVKLPEHFIKLANKPHGSLVIDPFNGSGTTGVAAINLKMKYIGIDIDEDYVNITKERLNKI